MSINSASFFPISKFFPRQKKMDFQVGMKRTQGVQKRTYNKKPKVQVVQTAPDAARKALLYGIQRRFYTDIQSSLSEEDKRRWSDDLDRMYEDWQQELRYEQILTPDLLDLFDRLDRENGEVGV